MVGMTMGMTMGMRMEQEEPEDVISRLEKALREESAGYVRSVASLDMQRGELFNPLAEYFAAEVQRISETKPSNRFFDEIIEGLHEMTSHFEQKKEKYSKELEKFGKLAEEAFEKYRTAVCNEFNNVFEIVAEQLEERGEELPESIGRAANLDSLQKELADLVSIEKQMGKLGPESAVAKAYYSRKSELQEEIEKTSEICDALSSSEPIHYPVKIETWNGGLTLQYAFPGKTNAVAELFETAVKSVLKTLGRRVTIHDDAHNSHSIRLSSINQDIAALLREELEKPEYEAVRKANVHPVYFNVPAAGRQIVEMAETGQIGGQKVYTMPQVMEELGLSKNELTYTLYQKHKDILENFGFKRGATRYLTSEGVRRLKEARENILPLKKSHEIIQRRIESIVSKYQAGESQAKIARELGVAAGTIDKALARAGVITPLRIRNNYNTLAKLRNAEFKGIPRYEKQNIRDEMLEIMIDILPESPKIRYFGLEGPNFGSYITLSNLAEIDSEKSIVAERDRKAYNLMKSIVDNCGEINGGKIFGGLKLYAGEASDALESNSGTKFNFVNLDYMGPLSRNKVVTIGKLFKRGMLDDESVLFVTLSEHKRFTEQIRNSLEDMLSGKYVPIFDKGGQEAVLGEYLKEIAAQNNYRVTEIKAEHYKSRKSPMLFMGYKVEKKK
ncbi:helix-turn-helix domain-containing protein [Candidatus Woesearchaeota archaeon]|nr:helix-turn-helix domain-containing protein [Candidatus Woesearchaeota archaeon]